MARTGSIFAATLIATACTGAHGIQRTSPTASVTVVTVTVPPSRYRSAHGACTAATAPIPGEAHGIFEVAGNATGGSLWALVFADAPFVAARQVKIAWRMTGVGPLMLSATNLNRAATVGPFNSPDAHSSSSWNRPGGEWGSVWVFPSAGCWRITATRENVSGNVTFMVITPPL